MIRNKVFDNNLLNSMKGTTGPENKSGNNIADWFSIYRIVASVVLILLLCIGSKVFFACILGISLATDIIDGVLARKLQIESPRGARLDSIGDAITFTIAATSLWVFEKEFLEQNKLLILSVVIPYFVQIGMAVIRYGRPSSFHTYLAKISALLQGCFMLILLFFGPLYWLFYFTIAVTLLEILEEIILVFLLKQNETDVKGLYWVLQRKRR